MRAYVGVCVGPWGFSDHLTLCICSVTVLFPIPYPYDTPFNSTIILPLISHLFQLQHHHCPTPIPPERLCSSRHPHCLNPSSAADLSSGSSPSESERTCVGWKLLHRRLYHNRPICDRSLHGLFARSLPTNFPPLLPECNAKCRTGDKREHLRRYREKNKHKTPAFPPWYPVETSQRAMASSPPASPSGLLQRSTGATVQMQRSSSRMSISSKHGGGSRASDEDGKTAVKVGECHCCRSPGESEI